MNSHALELTPGPHRCCMYRGAPQRDALLGPDVSPGIGTLIARTAAGQELPRDDFDIDDVGTGVVFEA